MPTTKTLQLSKYVRMVLENELKLTCKEFDEEDIKALLKKSNRECTPRETIQGYPSYPLYREIGNMLQQWMEKRYCPALDLPKYDLLDEKSYAESREANFKSITPLLDGLQTLWEDWNDEEIAYRVKEIMIHDVYILEVRQEEGYGARWTADGSSFRGFLEPQMVDGHSVGWKH
uniref:Uncharacterized protein n=1 Tax=Magallana gigas TaxID=29159 RepID=K1QZP0_MAGGI